MSTLPATDDLLIARKYASLTPSFRNIPIVRHVLVRSVLSRRAEHDNSYATQARARSSNIAQLKRKQFPNPSEARGSAQC